MNQKFVINGCNASDINNKFAENQLYVASDRRLLREVGLCISKQDIGSGPKADKEYESKTFNFLGIEGTVGYVSIRGRIVCYSKEER